MVGTDRGPARTRRQARDARLGAQAAGERVLRRSRSHLRSQARPQAANADPDRGHRLAARPAQCPERRLRHRRRACARPRPGSDPARPALVPRPRPSHGAGRPQGPRAVRQRFQGDQRRCRRACACQLLGYFLDRRRQGENRRHRRPRRIFSPDPQSLSDRRGGRGNRGERLMVSRAERSLFARWWWTVDKLMLAALAALMFGGIVLSLAASPPVAARLGLDPFHFVNRHVLFLIPAFLVLTATSLLTPRHIRRLAFVVFLVSLAFVVATFWFGAEVKGARRWIVVLGVNVQPSEFLKPAFVILIAWLFAESSRRPEMPANTMALGLLLLTVTLLVLQPDFGQSMLIALVWGALFFMAGMRMIWVMGLAGAATIGLAAAYFTVPHVAQRIKRFLDPSSGDTFQIDTALEAFAKGGWLGRGPGEGTVKRILPDSHADFVFAVAAEEFGIVLCLILLALFAFIVVRALLHAFRVQDSFVRFATAGLGMLFGLQSEINMGVNLHLIPAKGMKLPFISYGGSSLISLAYGMGMLLAIARERPAAAMLPPVDAVVPAAPAVPAAAAQTAGAAGRPA